jgi:RNA polymerase sigma-70 factor (ECF subfamily)
VNDSEQDSRFREWHREHQGIVVRIARATASTPPDQEDLIQDICVQIWNSIPNFNGDCKSSTWVYRVALNTAIAWGRRQQRERIRRQGAAENLHLLRETGDARNPRLEWLYEQIRQLNPVDRSLLLLHLDGQSYQEIAAILGISEKNVGVKLSRLRQTLTRKAEADEL